MENIKVLIADDNAKMRNLLQNILKSERDITVVGCAEDGEEAVDLIRKTEPDVVLLDVIMPKLDGLGVLEVISQDPSSHKSPTAIMITAVGQEKITEKALNELK